jgi:hypothetical protein
MSAIIDYKDALNQFYELKRAYEEKRSNRDNSKKKNLPQCISCGKMVGTIFKTELIKSDKFYGRKLSATCGDTKQKPSCGLDICIEIDFFQPFREKIQQYSDLIEKHKHDIITIKNDAVFYEKQNAVDIFNESIEKLKQDIKTQMAYIDQFRESISRKDTNTLKLELNNIISENKEIFETYKKQVKDGENRENNEISENPIKTIVETYCKQIVSLVSEIQQRKYAITTMDVTKISGMEKYTLVQIKNKPQDFLFPKESNNEYNIIKFETNSGSNQTKKDRSKKPSSKKNKTIKAVKDK